ncbi:ORF63 [Haliotid herpesvirus 1]|nr:ORF63 [Haliotid herpesvirus 1]
MSATGEKRKMGEGGDGGAVKKVKKEMFHVKPGAVYHFKCEPAEKIVSAMGKMRSEFGDRVDRLEDLGDGVFIAVFNAQIKRANTSFLTGETWKMERYSKKESSSFGGRSVVLAKNPELRAIMDKIGLEEDEKEQAAPIIKWMVAMKGEIIINGESDKNVFVLITVDHLIQLGFFANGDHSEQIISSICKACPKDAFDFDSKSMIGKTTVPGMMNCKIINPIKFLTSRFKNLLVVRSTMLSQVLSQGSGERSSVMGRFVHLVFNYLLTEAARKKIDEIGTQDFIETISKPALEEMKMELASSKLALEDKKVALEEATKSLEEEKRVTTIQKNTIEFQLGEIEVRTKTIEQHVDTIANNTPIEHSAYYRHLAPTEVEAYGVALISRTNPRTTDNAPLNPGEVLVQINYCDGNDSGGRNFGKSISKVFTAAKKKEKGSDVSGLAEPYGLFVGLTNPLKLRPKMIEAGVMKVLSGQSKRYNSLVVIKESHAEEFLNSLCDKALGGSTCTLKITKFGRNDLDEARAKRKNTEEEIDVLRKVRDEGVEGLWRRSGLKKEEKKAVKIVGAVQSRLDHFWKPRV